MKSRLPTVPEEEMELPDNERLALVTDLISGTEYAQAKRDISSNITEINQTLQTRMKTESEEQQRKVTVTRTMLLIATVLVITTLLVAFILLIRLLSFLCGFSSAGSTRASGSPRIGDLPRCAWSPAVITA